MSFAWDENASHISDDDSVFTGLYPHDHPEFEGHAHVGHGNVVVITTEPMDSQVSAAGSVTPPTPPQEHNRQQKHMGAGGQGPASRHHASLNGAPTNGVDHGSKRPGAVPTGGRATPIEEEEQEEDEDEEGITPTAEDDDQEEQARNTDDDEVEILEGNHRGKNNGNKEEQEDDDDDEEDDDDEQIDNDDENDEDYEEEDDEDSEEDKATAKQGGNDEEEDDNDDDDAATQVQNGEVNPFLDTHTHAQDLRLHVGDGQLHSKRPQHQTQRHGDGKQRSQNHGKNSLLQEKAKNNQAGRQASGRPEHQELYSPPMKGHRGSSKYHGENRSHLSTTEQQRRYLAEQKKKQGNGMVHAGSTTKDNRATINGRAGNHASAQQRSAIDRELQFSGKYGFGPEESEEESESNSDESDNEPDDATVVQPGDNGPQNSSIRASTTDAQPAGKSYENDKQDVLEELTPKDSIDHWTSTGVERMLAMRVNWQSMFGEAYQRGSREGRAEAVNTLWDQFATFLDDFYPKESFIISPYTKAKVKLTGDLCKKKYNAISKESKNVFSQMLSSASGTFPKWIFNRKILFHFLGFPKAIPPALKMNLSTAACTAIATYVSQNILGSQPVPDFHFLPEDVCRKVVKAAKSVKHRLQKSGHKPKKDAVDSWMNVLEYLKPSCDAEEGSSTSNAQGTTSRDNTAAVNSSQAVVTQASASSSSNKRASSSSVSSSVYSPQYSLAGNRLGMDHLHSSSPSSAAPMESARSVGRTTVTTQRVDAEGISADQRSQSAGKSSKYYTRSKEGYTAKSPKNTYTDTNATGAGTASVTDQTAARASYPTESNKHSTGTATSSTDRKTGTSSTRPSSAVSKKRARSNSSGDAPSESQKASKALTDDRYFISTEEIEKIADQADRHSASTVTKSGSDENKDDNHGESEQSPIEKDRKSGRNSTSSALQHRGHSSSPARRYLVFEADPFSCLVVQAEDSGSTYTPKKTPKSPLPQQQTQMSPENRLEMVLLHVLKEESLDATQRELLNIAYLALFSPRYKNVILGAAKLACPDNHFMFLPYFIDRVAEKVSELKLSYDKIAE
eukprot:gb/GECG01000462.1/.p1 GENE.gb/GECG01000462.1/~~gb/GECG01000462.1/.p1  ORF type:complete len:1073 (+),score=199.88 gb/GECG01000462.1/:1-3219(+)